MVSLNKNLYYAKKTGNSTIKLYSEKADCLDDTLGPFVHVNLDGIVGYAGLVQGNNAGSYPSGMKVILEGNIYTIQECGYHKITITQPTNGQIKIAYNNNEYISSFDAITEGVYIVTVTPNEGYRLLELKIDDTSIDNGSSQSCNKPVNVTATLVEVKLSYYGYANDLTIGRSGMAATTVGDYALFGGGRETYYGTTIVDAYNPSLTKSNLTDLSAKTYQLAATTVGDYALFAGGTSMDTSDSNAVDAYDSSLTKSTATALSSARYDLAATTVGDYALFAGGTRAVTTVDVYDSSLTKSTATALSQGRHSLAATTVGDYALFAGGLISTGLVNACNKVDAYDSSLTRISVASLASIKCYPVATTVGDYALFAGGFRYFSDGSSTDYLDVDVYDSSLTKSTATALSFNRTRIGATTLGNYALFSGNDQTNTLDVYDKFLTKSTENLNTKRAGIAATTVGDYALFAGGGNLYDSFKTVEVYQLS